MKTRKTALLLVLAMLISLLSACGDNATTDPSTEPAGSQTESTSDTTADTGSEPDTSTDEIKVITIAEALELCGEEGNLTTERYYIRGTVTKMINAAYGNMVVTDDTGSITVYGTYSADGSVKYSEMTDKAFEGDEVLLHCILQNYNGTKEVQNARLIEYKKGEITVDPSKYADMTVADIRAAAEGTLAKVDGVVAAITYANGRVPAGVILVDGTNSIYLYDRNLAAQVAVGNTITVLGAKTYWILEDEVNNANKFGYKGCCQLENITLVSNDKKTSDFDKSWIKETTVKNIMDNPKSNDITSSIYKVNALVKKAEGTGFTNYYFYDIDGKTGSYTYTQCNGSDFSWLDQYDGKICTVYLIALNAKSTSADCIYRLLPVAVKDEGYTFDKKDTPKHVAIYYGAGQFDAFYSGNPELELITTVSSDLLGFKDAALLYTSSDKSVVDFKVENGKVVMHCLSSGTAIINVIGDYNGSSYGIEVPITVEIANTDNNDYLTIEDAIKAEVGAEITVKGIVGPSLVNKSGFYLIDENGVISVLMESDVLKAVSLGQEVVLKGKRDLFDNPDKGGNAHGQTCITGCTVVTNNYGKHDYSTKTFVKDFTLEQFRNLDVTKDETTHVYIVKATVTVVETPYYTSIKLTNGSTEVSLYCANAGQYSFLKAYANQEVTLELAPCNWNDKTYYAACALAVYTADGKVYNELNFTK